MADGLITRVSDRGEVTLPEAVLERQHWDGGTELLVEETPEGVLLKRAPVFAPTPQGSAFGILKYTGRPKTIEEMDAGLRAAVAEDFKRSVDPDQ